MTTGPAEAGYYKSVPSFALDKRMIQMPAREVRRYDDSERRIQVMNHDKHVGNRMVTQSWGGESQSGLVDREIPVQPHSPKRPVHFQPVYDVSSSHTLNASDLPYREVFEEPSTPGLKSNTQRFPDSTASGSQSQRYDDAGREVRADFRNLAIDSRASHYYRTDDHLVMNDRDDTSYASSITRFPQRPHKDMPTAGHEGHHQLPTYSNTFETRQRSNLHNNINAFGNPGSMQSSNREEQPKFWAPFIHSGSGLPPTRESYLHTENENIRPPPLHDGKSNQARSRAPGAIVVLD